MLVFYDQWKIICPMEKCLNLSQLHCLEKYLKNFEFESHWNTLMFFDKKICCQIWICPMEKYLILFHSHCPTVWVYFSHKTDKFGFWRSLKYFDVFWYKKWCQIWLCPVKQCLIWFKLLSLSRILAIRWEIRILHFIKIV